MAPLPAHVVPDADRLARFEREARAVADERARMVVAAAIQRYASEHVVEQRACVVGGNDERYAHAKMLPHLASPEQASWRSRCTVRDLVLPAFIPSDVASVWHTGVPLP